MPDRFNSAASNRPTTVREHILNMLNSTGIPKRSQQGFESLIDFSPIGDIADAGDVFDALSRSSHSEALTSSLGFLPFIGSGVKKVVPKLVDILKARRIPDNPSPPNVENIEDGFIIDGQFYTRSEAAQKTGRGVTSEDQLRNDFPIGIGFRDKDTGEVFSTPNANYHSDAFNFMNDRATLSSDPQFRYFPTERSRNPSSPIKKELINMFSAPNPPAKIR